MIKWLKNIWVILAIGIIAGILIGRFVGNDRQQESVSHSNHNEDEQPTIWTCSMHPQIQQDKAGQCPLCGMDLIPLDNSNDESMLTDEVPMSESAMKLAEIQTYLIKKENPEKTLRLLGKVKADERLMYSQTVHFPGRIEKLFVNFTGEKVKKGQKLATVYSTELISAQKELIEVLKDKSTNPALVNAARNKLKQWKLTEEQISRIENSKEVENEINILSDYDGYVMMRMISEGDHFKEGQILFEITDLSKVWVLFEAYENDLPWVRKGDNIEIELKSIPGKNIKGKVAYIDPFINPKTRVAYIRVELSNGQGLLKPDMFAKGLIVSNLPISSESILVPKSSILWTGKRAVVYVKIPNREQHSFIYREVILGEEAGEFYVIKEGLKIGETIASNGVFKIDASAQLAGKKSMMNPVGGKTSNGHNHGDKEMDMSKMTPEIKLDKSSIPDQFKSQLGDVVNAYLSLKTKLAQDNSNIQQEVKSLQQVLDKMNMNLILGDAHNEWMKTLKILDKELDGLSESVNIQDQRNTFLTVSKTLTKSVDNFGVKMKNMDTIYIQFCPMADDNKGGNWLSSKKEIRNPYFGKSMLQCGEIQQQLKVN